MTQGGIYVNIFLKRDVILSIYNNSYKDHNCNILNLKNFRLLRLMHKLSDSLPMFSSGTKPKKFTTQKRIDLSCPIHNSATKLLDTAYCSGLFLKFPEIGFGFETKIAGRSEPSNFHALAIEVLTRIPR